MDFDALVVAQVFFVFMLAVAVEQLAVIVVDIDQARMRQNIGPTNLSGERVTTLIVGLIVGIIVVNTFELDLAGSVFNIEVTNHEWFNAIGIALGAEFMRVLRLRFKVSNSGDTSGGSMAP